MIKYSGTCVGDKLRITGIGAEGFAKLGDIVTVTRCNKFDTLHVSHDVTGEQVYFTQGCGAARLEKVE